MVCVCVGVWVGVCVSVCVCVRVCVFVCVLCVCVDKIQFHDYKISVLKTNNLCTNCSLQETVQIDSQMQGMPKATPHPLTC